MGLRHLEALLSRGYSVDVYDPSAKAQAAAYELAARMSSSHLLRVVSDLSYIQASYDVAVFAEPAQYRLANLKAFLASSQANRTLLEKPLTATEEEISVFESLCHQTNISDSIYVHYIRRSWPHIQSLKNVCESQGDIDILVNGGAVGIGCNGIHFIDLLLFLNDYKPTTCTYSFISPTLIPSGRGVNYFDFGGSFRLESTGFNMTCNLSATSSAKPIMSIIGENICACVDYQHRTLNISSRESVHPVYKTGLDYKNIQHDSPFVPSAVSSIQSWLDGTQVYPSLQESLVSHRLLFDVLARGLAKQPYNFT